LLDLFGDLLAAIGELLQSLRGLQLRVRAAATRAPARGGGELARLGDRGLQQLTGLLG
jgi:hypothetical protein